MTAPRLGRPTRPPAAEAGGLWRAVLWAIAGALAFGLALSPVPRAVGSLVGDRLGEVALASTGVYASLKTINAGISLIQEAQLGGGVGVSGAVQPLAWLDPVDDTVERMAELVFWVALGATLLALSVEPFAALGWVCLALAALVRCGGCLMGRGRAARAGERGLTVLGLALAILLPAAVVLGLEAGARLTEARWDGAMATLSAVTEEADRVVEPYSEAEEESFVQSLRNRWEGTRDFVSGYYRLGGALWAESEALFGAILTLAGVFLLRLVVLPAAILAAAVALVRRMA